MQKLGPKLIGTTKDIDRVSALFTAAYKQTPIGPFSFILTTLLNLLSYRY